MKTHAQCLTHLLLPLLLVAGCTTPAVRTTDTNGGIQLDLVAAENIAVPWPPSLLVERRDGSGVSLSNGLSSVGAEYVPGLAVLMVANQSNQPQTLHDWSDHRWRIVIEREGGSRKEFALLDRGKSLPSLPRPAVILKPGQVAAVIVGLAGYLPVNQQYLNEPLAPCRMRVVYSNDSIFRSNDLIVQPR